MFNFNIGVLGHVDSGKTSLSKALSVIASTAAFDKNPQSKERGITLDLGFSSFTVDAPEHIRTVQPDIKKIQCTLVDCPGHASLIRTIIGGAQIIDLILLVVDVTKGIQTQTAECLVIGEITCQHLIIVLNKIDLLEENKRMTSIEKMTKKLKQALKTTAFPDPPIVPVSAFSKENETLGIPDLLNTISESIFSPVRNVNGPFLFAIDHCFAIKGKGTVLTGTVLQGSIKVDDVIELPGLGTSKKVKSMQMFKQSVTSATSGDRLGICVTQFDPKLIERGIACTSGLASYAYCAVISAKKIKYFKGEISSKAKFHITIGYETLLATITCFSTSSHSNSFNFADHFQYSAVLSGEENYSHYLLLEFEKPVLVIDGCKVIGSKLDLDILGNNCRIAFWGILLSYSKDKDYKPKYLSNLNVYKHKTKTGTVERLASDNTVIVKGLFKKETDLSYFMNLNVTLSTGETGVIESSFGQSGKVKVYVKDGLKEETLSLLKRNSSNACEKTVITVTLLFKKFVFNNGVKNVQ
ncbi:hypothetical protein RI129_009204 [Pyrocoelia pectoralis]|uniref:Selenocysteine-specific elongation factor n=1 Tax=Pyrocoelia pectoralis TaxID=417401 RepID=A0AAN7ZGL9_9COLE